MRHRCTVAGKKPKPLSRPSAKEQVTLEELQRQLKELHQLIEKNQVDIQKNQQTLREVSTAAVSKLRTTLDEVGSIQLGSTNYQVGSIFNRWTLLISAAGLGVGYWTYKDQIKDMSKDKMYDKMGKEVSTVVERVIKDEELHRTAIALIEGLTTDPKTLAALVVLLKQLIADPSTLTNLVQLIAQLFKDERTVNNLVYLLQTVFRNPDLQQTTGEFLLKSLDTTEAKVMLHQQTTAWISKAVLDKQVQADTGHAIRNSVKHAANPMKWFQQRPKLPDNEADENAEEATNDKPEKTEDATNEAAENVEETTNETAKHVAVKETAMSADKATTN